eukprot:TRINITY_DN40140_c0_g1_i1.p1 TRINITY_DN40140_c0_g1~~TRINITY_DN40140_c0_g1_i1.p1  ORF type:complete len:301 (-),score=32.21 TRINITY_DN40140_c0_g1_i1:338-1240(-)
MAAGSLTEKDVFQLHSGSRRFGPTTALTIWRSRGQRSLATLAVIVYAISMYLYLVCTNVLTYLSIRSSVIFSDGEDLVNQPAMHDFGHKVIPDIQRDPSVLGSALMAFANINGYIPSVILFSYLLRGKTKRLVVFAAMLILCSLSKVVVENMTLMPSSQTDCFHKRGWDFELVGKNALWFFTSSYGLFACNDMMFSGHTCEVVLALLAIRDEVRCCLPQGKAWLYLTDGLFLGYFALFTFAILGARWHYSSDVLVGLIISLLVFTHSRLRHSIWNLANRIVGNVADVQDMEDDFTKPLSA